jgi:hypothetical protein
MFTFQLPSLDGSFGWMLGGLVRRLVTVWVLLALASVALGESLGDVARQTRQKQKVKATANKKVITNEDIPESPAQPASPEAAGNPEPALSANDAPKPLTALQGRERIVTQKTLSKLFARKSIN